MFDPFCESGTMGVAAKELERFFAGAETERSFAGLAGRGITAADTGITPGEIRTISGGTLLRGRWDIGVEQR